VKGLTIMAASKAVTKADEATDLVAYAPFEVADTGLMEDLADELDGLDGVSFDRVKIPAGGGIAWELPSDDPDNPEISREIIGVIVDDHPSSALWLDDGDGLPDASSIDGKTQVVNPDSMAKFEERGLPIPKEDLKECPYNQFGSLAMIGKEGKGKATKNVWRLYVMLEGKYLPILVTIPPTSLKGFKAYKTNRVVGQGFRLCDVLTKLTLRKETGGDNDYSVVQFALVGPLEPAAQEAMRSMRNGVRPMTRRVQVDMNDYDTVEVVDLESAPADEGTFGPGVTPGDDEIPM